MVKDNFAQLIFNNGQFLIVACRMGCLLALKCLQSAICIYG